MKKSTFITLCTGTWLLTLAPLAWSQNGGFPGDGPPNGGPRGVGNRGPRGGRGMGEKGDLMRLWRGIGRLGEQNKPLSKSQSKSIVALVLPWSKKPAMTQIQVKALHQRLEATLTSVQKTSLDDGRRGFGGPRGGGYRPDGPPGGDGPRGGGRRGEEGGRGPDGRGPGGPDDGGPRERGGRGPDGRGPGGRGPGGMNLTEAQRKITRAWMETSNPFYAPTGIAGWTKLPAEYQKDVARRYKENRATLEMLSRQSR